MIINKEHKLYLKAPQPLQQWGTITEITTTTIRKTTTSIMALNVYDNNTPTNTTITGNTTKYCGKPMFHGWKPF